MSFVFAPTQAAEFSGPGKQAIVLYAPDWSEVVLQILNLKPAAYEASWSYQEERRAHVLRILYEEAPQFQVALIDGIHNAVMAALARGAALVLSPYPLYKDPPDQPVERLFDPAVSLALPELPNPMR